MGLQAGQGEIAQYSITGTLGRHVGRCQPKPAQGSPATGFTEATSFVVVPPPSPSGPPVGFFARDAAVSTMVNAPAMQSSFFSTLMSYGTDNLEADAGQSHPKLTFGTTGVTASTDFDGAVTGPPGSASSGSVSLLALPTSQTMTTHSLTFNSPITAFGAYFLDGGQGQSNVLTLELDNTITGTSTDVLLGTIGPDWTSGNVLYFGVTDATAFNRVVLLESNSSDELYLDDITAGFENLHNLIVPANGIVTLEPTSDVNSTAAFGQAAVAEIGFAGPNSAQAVPEPPALLLAGFGLAIAGVLISRATTPVCHHRLSQVSRL